MRQDLRSFVEAYGRAFPSEVVRVTEPVTTDYDVMALVLEYERRRRFPILLLERVQGSDIPIVCNVVASRRALAFALGTPEAGLALEYARRIKDPIKPVVVADPPFRRHVVTGRDLDLARLPIPTYFPGDAGRYLTAGLLVARDPETGVETEGYHRFQVKGRDRMGVSLHSRRRMFEYQRRAEALKQPLPCAIVLGVHPLVSMGSLAYPPPDLGKFEVVGGLFGAPLEVAPCATIDLQVPAAAEIVIEGEILPGVREPEGPFGEVAGTYGLQGNRHVFEVSAITMRRDAMYQTALTGMPTTDNHVQGWPAICESIKRMAQQACPEVVDVHAIGPYYIAIVSIRKRLVHEARNVILSVLGPTAGAPQAKYCIVVDPDVNVRDINQVLWALYTRVQPDQDALIFPPMIGAPLDPSAPVHRHSSKMGFDATVPLGASSERYGRVVVPGVDEVSW